MGIELLWLLPLLSLVIFGFFIMLRLQGLIGEGYSDETRKLTREVNEFNKGASDTDIFVRPENKGKGDHPEETVSFRSMDSVYEVIEKQNSIIKDKLHKSNVHDEEVNSVKQCLSSFRHQYDSVKSENFALKTQVKQLSEKNVELLNRYQEVKQKLEDLESGINEGRIVSISGFKEKKAPESKKRSGTEE